MFPASASLVLRFDRCSSWTIFKDVGWVREVKIRKAERRGGWAPGDTGCGRRYMAGTTRGSEWEDLGSPRGVEGLSELSAQVDTFQQIFLVDDGIWAGIHLVTGWRPRR